MKTFAFERWCDRLQLPTATRDFLLRLRSSPPLSGSANCRSTCPFAKLPQEIYAGTPTRTIRDWLTNFRDAEAAYGYVGLLPKTAARGKGA